MNRARYACIFALAVAALSIGGLFAFRRLETRANATALAAEATLLDTLTDARPLVPIMADPSAYARFEAEDAAWRRRDARQYSLAELRVRGDGKRTPQELLQDRVYAYTRRGDRAGAINELERWVSNHPSDQRALLALARLLNESGRNDQAVARYRQLLEVKQRSGNQ
jgi:tetratricopeptide (TPR) repeat protein